MNDNVYLRLRAQEVLRLVAVGAVRMDKHVQASVILPRRYIGRWPTARP
jgi:hypothetical protein